MFQNYKFQLMSKWFCYDAGGPKINMLWKAGAKVVFAWNLSLITSSKFPLYFYRLLYIILSTNVQYNQTVYSVAGLAHTT